MKRTAISCLVVAFTAAALLPGAANANGDTTTTSADAAGVPTECFVPIDDFGPSRAAHAPAIEEDDAVMLPDCDDIDGLCVEIIVADGGPARAAHRTNEEAVITGVPCTPIHPACDIVIDTSTDGPARAAHQPAELPERYFVVDIPEACQEALSLAALPDSGSDSATIMWLGAALVGIGGALVLTRRTALVRSR